MDLTIGCTATDFLPYRGSKPVFFFCLDGVHRHLHSFPTRRSSDLCRRSWFTSCTLVPEPAAMRLRREPEMIDRKSTRLNSSHVEISYAVFCLKKKMYRYNIPYIYGFNNRLHSDRFSAVSRLQTGVFFLLRRRPPTSTLFPYTTLFRSLPKELVHILYAGARAGSYALAARTRNDRSEEHTSELQSRRDFVCRLLLEKKNVQVQYTVHLWI